MTPPPRADHLKHCQCPGEEKRKRLWTGFFPDFHVLDHYEKIICLLTNFVENGHFGGVLGHFGPPTLPHPCIYTVAQADTQREGGELGTRGKLSFSTKPEKTGAHKKRELKHKKHTKENDSPLSERPAKKIK